MLIPDGLASIEVDPFHFCLTPAITIEPVNEELCLFFKWGPVSFCTEVHVGKKISRGIWKVQCYITSKINNILSPYKEAYNEKIEKLIQEGKIEWPKNFEEAVLQLREE